MTIRQPRHRPVHRGIGRTDRIAIIDAASNRLDDRFARKLTDDDLVWIASTSTSLSTGGSTLAALLRLQVHEQQHNRSDHRRSLLHNTPPPSRSQVYDPTHISTADA